MLKLPEYPNYYSTLPFQKTIYPFFNKNIMSTKTIKAIGTTASTDPLRVMNIERRSIENEDVEIEIMYCGICHSDLHAAKNDWGGSNYPLVPGHEIIGKVIATGKHVTKCKINDIVGVGCIVDSCRNCCNCKNCDEQFCDEGWTVVFNSKDKKRGGITFGGFSTNIIVDENYIVHIPKELDLASAAPILCAGITVYSPLKHWNANKNKHVGVIGMGGLGHLAIKIAKAMGSYVTVFTTTPNKAKDSLKHGADYVVIASNENEMKACPKQDIILNTASGKHNVNAYINLLKVDGSLIMVGIPAEPLEIGAYNVIKGRKSFSGSNIGGIAETQEVLNFCAEHNISADIELINPNYINTAFERLSKGDVHYRFVIDMRKLKE